MEWVEMNYSVSRGVGLKSTATVSGKVGSYQFLTLSRDFNNDIKSERIKVFIGENKLLVRNSFGNEEGIKLHQGGIKRMRHQSQRISSRLRQKIESLEHTQNQDMEID